MRHRHSAYAGLTAVALAAILTGCSGNSSVAHSGPPSTAPGSPATSGAPSTPADTSSPSPAIKFDLSSPALAKYTTAQVATALDVATHIAHLGVSDDDLLAHTTRHANLSYYSKITAYMTPTAISDLGRLVRDAYSNQDHLLDAGTLAAAAYPTSGKSAVHGKNTSTLPDFVEPFSPHCIADISHTVGLDKTGRMTITGTASARIPAHRGGRDYVDTLRQTFTYTLAPAAAVAGGIGLTGWWGNTAATYKAGHVAASGPVDCG